MHGVIPLWWMRSLRIIALQHPECCYSRLATVWLLKCKTVSREHAYLFVLSVLLWISALCVCPFIFYWWHVGWDVDAPPDPNAMWTREEHTVSCYFGGLHGLGDFPGSLSLLLCAPIRKLIIKRFTGGPGRHKSWFLFSWTKSDGRGEQNCHNHLL